MQNQHTRRGNTQKVVSKKETCPEVFGGPQGLRTFRACCCKIEENSLLNKYVEDPQLQPSGMTPLYDNCLTARGFILRPSSSRSVSMRDIGAAHTLYPALQACGVTKCVSRGFTLIELLVVVLIIGILAAVALPQYQKAVIKSRMMQAVSYLEAVKQAEEIYYLEQGNYTTDMSQLSIQADMPRPWSCSLQNAVTESKASCSYPGIMSLFVSFDRRWGVTRGKIYCAVHLSQADTLAAKVCAGMGPLYDVDNGYARYAISR